MWRKRVIGDGAGSGWVNPAREYGILCIKEKWGGSGYDRSKNRGKGLRSPQVYDKQEQMAKKRGKLERVSVERLSSLGGTG